MTSLVHTDFFYSDYQPLVFPTHRVEDSARPRYNDDTPEEPLDPASDADIGNFVPTPRARLVFGLNLRRARRLHELSQQRFAVMAGVSRSYIGEIEHGRHNICINRMESLARALGLELRDLLDAALYAPGAARRDN